jgi:hypothetical protein
MAEMHVYYRNARCRKTRLCREWTYVAGMQGSGPGSACGSQKCMSRGHMRDYFGNQGWNLQFDQRVIVAYRAGASGLGAEGWN